MKRPRTEPELREWLAKRLKVAEIEPRLWDWLREDGAVEEALAQDEETAADGREWLVTHARKQLRRHLQAGTAPRARGPETRQIPTPPVFGEAARARAFSGHLAAHAAQRPAVRQFRREFLEGRTLTPEEANAFLESPALRYLRPEQLRELGIPILGHRSEEWEQPWGHYTDEEVRQEMAAAGREGREPFEGKPRPFAPNPWVRTLYVEWPGGSIEERFTWERQPGWTCEQELMILAYPGPGPYVAREGVWPGSVLAFLVNASKTLTLRYSPWEEYQATWFVLTGHAPSVRPLRVSYRQSHFEEYSHYVLTLQVEPWVPASTVLRTYRDLQRRLLGRENRPLTLHALAVFEFVTGRRAAGGKVSWRQLMQEWNSDPARKPYRDPRQFQRTYERTEHAVVDPQYHPLKRNDPTQEGDTQP